MGVCLIIRTSGGTDTSGATATAARVLSGYTCYVNDVKITGTMANQGTKTASLNAGGSYTIPAGYHSGSGKVTANALSGQTSGTAGAAHILSGYNAWVNGTNTWGNMPNWGNIYHSLPANGSYTIPAGWHAGGGVVNQSLAFHWGGTYTPNTANQVICWANWYAAGSIVILGSSALVAGNIKKGVKIFGVTGTWTGPVEENPPFSAYYATNVCNTSKIYRSANYNHRAVLSFSGTVAQHISLMNSMRSAGYTRLWIEANFDYYTHVGNDSNAARARFDLKEPDGTVHNYKGVTVSRYAYFHSSINVQNIWVFLNDEIWDWDYSTPAITVNPTVTVWFADEWSQWSNTDWFQMTKWACWFSKS